MRPGDLFRVSAEEYLRGEESAVTKSEWVDGVVYNMAGATKLHVATVGALFARLFPAARGQGCLIGSSDLLVQTEHAFYYPDVVVSCDPDDHERIESRPCFIAEVLSPSTRRVDRHEKREAYLQIESMQTYWVVDPETHVVEAWTRTESGRQGSHRTASDLLRVDCLDMEVAVVDIFG